MRSLERMLLSARGPTQLNGHSLVWTGRAAPVRSPRADPGWVGAPGPDSGFGGSIAERLLLRSLNNSYLRWCAKNNAFNTSPLYDFHVGPAARGLYKKATDR